MREYPMKKGLSTNLEDIKEKVQKYSNDIIVKDQILEFSIPGLAKVEVLCGQKNLQLETKTDEKYPEPLKAIKQFNNLLLDLTGFDSKERKKRFSKI